MTKGLTQMMTTLLLICALGIPQAECSATTAEAVIQGPDAMGLIECGLHGQAYIAGGAIANYLDGAHYLKIACTSAGRVPAASAQSVQSAGAPLDALPVAE
jgi:hypothetical protein